jgi:hypothetical protein
MSEVKSIEQRLVEAKPKISIAHHIAATLSSRRISVKLHDGSEWSEVEFDFAFTDGISIVTGGRRIYLPMSAIGHLEVLNPK